MKLGIVLKKVKESVEENGVKETLKYIGEKAGDMQKKYRILLLTNRDSDNVGDQVIEACDIGLIQTVMQNLGIPESDYAIESRAASLVTKKYLATRDEKLLEAPELTISTSSVIVFGGAPLFNFLYQDFYERTAVTLELAKKHNVPAIFSAIGIEGYSDTNEKCQRLKKTLNFDCVRQITTRDGIEYLKQYKENENMVIDKVSDPAVFSDRVFQNHLSEKKNGKKKIGIFILRSNGFTDNKVNFPREEAAKLWISLANELEARGYDYEFLTSGHFGDEAFLDYLIKNYNLNEKKCAFGINRPEDLVGKISSYDGVVSCRLHPSIISFAFEVPSIGIVWNSKVPGFYESMGYPDRVITTESITAQKVLDQLEVVMKQGVEKDKEYLATVYTTLFHGLKNIFKPDADVQPYNYDELMEQIVPYKGTSGKERKLKVVRKMRRTYGKYNELFDKNLRLKEEVKQLKEKLNQLKECK